MKTKHIGIVACSAEGAALCYRTICREAAEFMGEHNHPEITMHTYPLSQYMVYIRKREWENVSRLMLSSTGILEQAGAELAICPDNTIHEAYPLVEPSSPIPWLHIAEEVAREAYKNKYGKLGITGTKYLMTGPVYPSILKAKNIGCEIPDAADRKSIDDIIFTELVNGIFSERSRLYFNEVFQKFKDKGCEAVVLGCTEIPLLVDPNDSPLPVLDSTRILARAALKRSLGME
jgi:aspartate racemase